MICENIFTAPKGIQIALLVQSYGDFAERVDFFYWWSFSGEGSAPAACAAGLFFLVLPICEITRDLRVLSAVCSSVSAAWPDGPNFRAGGRPAVTGIFFDHIDYCIVWRPYCTVYTAQHWVHWTVLHCDIQCTVHSAQCTVYSVQLTPNIVQRALDSVQSTVDSSVYSVDSKLKCTVHFRLYILQCCSTVECSVQCCSTVECSVQCCSTV